MHWATPPFGHAPGAWPRTRSSPLATSRFRLCGRASVDPRRPGGRRRRLLLRLRSRRRAACGVPGRGEGGGAVAKRMGAGEKARDPRERPGARDPRGCLRPPAGPLPAGAAVAAPSVHENSRWKMRGAEVQAMPTDPSQPWGAAASPPGAERKVTGLPARFQVQGHWDRIRSATHDNIQHCNTSGSQGYPDTRSRCPPCLQASGWKTVQVGVLGSSSLFCFWLRTQWM